MAKGGFRLQPSCGENQHTNTAYYCRHSKFATEQLNFQFDTFIFVFNIYNYDVEGTGNVFTESKCT